MELRHDDDDWSFHSDVKYIVHLVPCLAFHFYTYQQHREGEEKEIFVTRDVCWNFIADKLHVDNVIFQWRVEEKLLPPNGVNSSASPPSPLFFYRYAGYGGCHACTICYIDIRRSLPSNSRELLSHKFQFKTSVTCVSPRKNVYSYNIYFWTEHTEHHAWKMRDPEQSLRRRRHTLHKCCKWSIRASQSPALECFT